ncbi:hypothetical protein VTL71DRAFT_15451 [Oculimacula yallundae]|uniref:Seed maturation protein n=1 Tax=Oculimacula yallundae TaxID=86028 RepID=A0ABR4CIS5_9HELO
MSERGTTSYDGPGEAFVSMDPERTKVRKAADASVKKPEPAASQGTTTSQGTRDATNQQFNSDGTVKQ